MKIMVTSFKHPICVLLHSMPPALQQATIDPCLCWRLLDTHGQVWASLLWSHYFPLLGHGAHKVLFVPSKSLFPKTCVSSGSSMVRLMATSSKRAYAIPKSAVPRACNCRSPLLISTSTGDAQTQFWLILCGVPGSWCAQGSCEPSERLWREWDLILNVNFPLLPSCWGFSFAPRHGVSPHGRSSAMQPPLQHCTEFY